jgi:hypothetical protein
MLSERNAEQLLEKAAQVIVKRGMEVPAILFLGDAQAIGEPDRARSLGDHAHLGFVFRRGNDQ